MKKAPRIFVTRGVITSENLRLKRGVLQLLQRTHLEAHGSRLRRKPFVFTCERVLAEALLLGWHILRDHLQQSRQSELLRALLVNRCNHRFFEGRQQGLGRLRLHARALGQVNGQRRFRERILDRFQASRRIWLLYCRCSCLFRYWRSFLADSRCFFCSGRCRFLGSGSSGFLRSGCCHEYLSSSQRLPKAFAFAPSPTNAKVQILGLGASVSTPRSE